MAVVAKWMCDRDNSMFDNKKDADAYDKMLELAEGFSALLQQHIPDVDETKAEEFGIFLAKNKEAIMQACKGRVEALEEIDSQTVDNVRPLSAQAS
ncbi:YebG family protein [uncultured Zhongshania sp.]|uniref:YebG family protein n=1 Tax=uncultured Zhongshania sp. TaxID=1642288 RepID=UPI0025E572F0|nr:YebG family protein [uncultured Zhongshania sp.]|tara:strand:- start:15845 stop:16132 length:288 start_codon:yes stop_codon:yes gene_type:complete